MASSCSSCLGSLNSKKYVMQNQMATCLHCYEVKFANHCRKCGKAIGHQSKDVTYNDEHYHDTCFACASCKKPLSSSQFTTRGDSRVCVECYNSKFAEECDFCHKIFKHGMEKMEYNGKKYHSDCFKCFKCKKPIGTQKFVPQDGEIWCMNCYNDSNFVSKCGGCTKIIKRCGLNFDGVIYHKECFVCRSCKSMLAGVKYATRDGQPYCAECHAQKFAKKCELCNRPISGLGMSTKFISFEGRQWHTQCFRCHVCSKSLASEGFLQKNSRIMCGKCGC